eukprot:TRINITY_DN3660_c1_g3_i1.p1 TRINITY_DN3660_c1_g3~~TRINITY_DN3660_c1_g3_i1.p1  ORF type:complete len:1276 (+),score=207.07 TRINITY_DN3660_c1_g3_i1:41-3868(+)
MGVPKFFRFFAERYPCIAELTDGDTICTVDNLYLDMNGIIHVCSHNNQDLLRGSLQSHDEMVRNMLSVIEKLFNAVRPRKHFLMCIDGVAPRAKMNQQRQRRFRAAEELQLAAEEAKAKGETVHDPSNVFDSNVITPGTPFMETLDGQLRYFINHKVSADPSWQGVKIVFSGHDVPGEGEHKIMEFMRNRKVEKDYCTTETHCIYGLDADLIMLALASQEHHIMLLRDIVRFETTRDAEKKEELRRKGIEREKLATPEQYVLLHIGVFRDYLDHDISKKGRLRGKRINWNKVHNDFIVMCFLIGNDFLPCLPVLSINDGAIPVMFKIYAEYLLERGWYLTDDKSNIKWEAMLLFLTEIGKLELQMTQDKEKNERDYQKRAMRADRTIVLKTVTATENIDDRKREYYTDKLGFTETGELKKMIYHWVEGVQWVWEYYTKGVPSWKYFYPYNYCPYASDIASSDIVSYAAQIQFADPGVPFTPFQQLLGVLPPSSITRCLPSSFHNIPFEPDMHYAFPKKLSIDRDNAHAPWEGIVRIPFLKEEDIIKYTKNLGQNFTESEKSRNKLRNACVYTHSTEGAPKTIASTFEGLPDLKVKVNSEKIELRKRVTPAPLSHQHPVPQMGFGSLFSKKRFDSYLKQRVVEIFGKPTYRESLIIKLPGSDSLEAYNKLVGTMVWIGWPHFKYSRVMRLADVKKTVKGKSVTQHTPEKQEAFRQLAKEHETKLLRMRGISTEVTVLVAVRHMAGILSVHNKAMPRLSSTEVWYPAQLLSNHDCKIQHNILNYLDCFRNPQTILRTPVMYLPHNGKQEELWGNVGSITSVSDGKALVSLTPSMDYPALPESLEKRLDTSNWILLSDICYKMRVSLPILMNLCGSITTSKGFGSKELGMGLLVQNQQQYYGRLGYIKFAPEEARSALEVGHYLYMGTRDVVANRLIDLSTRGKLMRGTRTERGRWMVSPKCRELIVTYLQEFNPIINALECESIDNLDANRLRNGAWTDVHTNDIIAKIQDFITTVEYKKAPLIGVTEDVLPFEDMERLENIVRSTKQQAATKDTIHLRIQQQLNDVYAPKFFPVGKSECAFLQPPQYEPKESIRLGARVVNMKAIGGIPFGARGIVTRLLGDSATVEVLLDEECLSGSTLGGRLKTYRGALIRSQYLLPVRNLNPKKAVFPEKQILTRTATESTDTPPKVVLKKEASQEQSPTTATVASTAAGAATSPSTTPHVVDPVPHIVEDVPHVIDDVDHMKEFATHISNIPTTLSKPAIDMSFFMKGLRGG